MRNELGNIGHVERFLSSFISIYFGSSSKPFRHLQPPSWSQTSTPSGRERHQCDLATAEELYYPRYHRLFFHLLLYQSSNPTARFS